MDSADCRFGHSSRARSSCIYRLGSAAALFVLLLSVSNSVGMLLVEGAANAQAGISRYDICVVGGGVGGLVCAGLLQKSGQSVFLVDKSSRVGGRMGSFHLSVPPEPGPSEPTELSELSGLLAPSIAQEISTGRSLGNPTEELATATGGNRCFRFDTGPSLLLMPDVYRETFSLLGEKLEDHVEILSVSPMYRCFFEEDLTHADITANSTIMEETLEKIESGSFPKFQEYMQIASCFLRFGWPNVIEEKLELSSLPDFLSACIRAFPLRSHESVLRDFFASPKVRAMLSFQDLYVGLSPSEAPAVFALLQALELEKGIFYPKGGFAEVSAALKKIAENHGVQISTDSTVKGLHVQNKRVQQAVVVDPKGQRIVEANKFVFNGDVPQTEMNLFVDHNMVDTEVVSARPSCGVVSLHFAFNQTLNGLLHHTLFLSDSYDHSWRTVEHPDNASFDPKKFNFYVHAPSRTDPSCCPAGTDAVTVLVPVPPLGMDDSRKYNTAEIRSAVLSRMEKQLQNMGLWQGNLETAIIGEVVNDPSYFKGKYDLFRGSAFGLTHNLRQLSLLRPGFKHPKLSNCYRVGASTRPGNGVPLVMVGAKLAAKTIMEDTS